MVNLFCGLSMKCGYRSKAATAMSFQERTRGSAAPFAAQDMPL